MDCLILRPVAHRDYSGLISRLENIGYVENKNYEHMCYSFQSGFTNQSMNKSIFVSIKEQILYWLGC